MSDSQMKNIGQIQPAKKPTKDKIDCAYQHSNPRSQMSWGGIHASQHVAQNNQIACDIVDSHGGSGGRYSSRNRSSFQITSYFSPLYKLSRKESEGVSACWCGIRRRPPGNGRCLSAAGSRESKALALTGRRRECESSSSATASSQAPSASAPARSPSQSRNAAPHPAKSKTPLHALLFP